ncbi:hypothetical protein [uncultured Nostoc sp.]|uniref:hypothetical protein n=1 Tax=uncultured Nostoc sp. TaxID=340711 RepID=UPI0035CC6817
MFSVENAWAGSTIFDPVVDNCTTVNCGSVDISGISEKNAFGDSVPFIVQVFGDANECIRLDVVFQSADTKIVLVSPSGKIWSNDDTNGTRPLVVAIGDVKGYYTVQINYYNGNQAINSGQAFTLAYGRYVSTNSANCSSPTVSALRPLNAK